MFSDGEAAAEVAKVFRQFECILWSINLFLIAINISNFIFFFKFHTWWPNSHLRKTTNIKFSKNKSKLTIPKCNYEPNKVFLKVHLMYISWLILYILDWLAFATTSFGNLIHVRTVAKGQSLPQMLINDVIRIIFYPVYMSISTRLKVCVMKQNLNVHYNIKRLSSITS